LFGASSSSSGPGTRRTFAINAFWVSRVRSSAARCDFFNSRRRFFSSLTALILDGLITVAFPPSSSSSVSSSMALGSYASSSETCASPNASSSDPESSPRPAPILLGRDARYAACGAITRSATAREGHRVLKWTLAKAAANFKAAAHCLPVRVRSAVFTFTPFSALPLQSPLQSALAVVAARFSVSAVSFAPPVRRARPARVRGRDADAIRALHRCRGPPHAFGVRHAFRKSAEVRLVYA
jgi:hypothetical protein